MRRYHRSISLLFGLFLLVITVTGVLLHVREFLDEGGGKEKVQQPSSTLASGMPAEWTTALNKGLAAVYVQKPDVRIERIRIDLKDEKPRFVLQTGGEHPVNYIIADDGHILKAAPQEKNLLLRLHTGEVLGDAGEVLAFVMGLGLLGLLVTGGVMLWQMFRAAPNGKTGLRRIFGVKP